MKFLNGEPISTFVYADDDWNTPLSVTPLYQAVSPNGDVAVIYH